MKHSYTKHKYHSLYNPVKVIEHNWSDNMIPMVSVVCITFNNKQYIRDTIKGFLMQKTTFKIEILIGEDCSTDGTREIVSGYKKKYPDLIKVITSNSNVGMYANGIRTLNAVRGKYIALCDGDDYWTDSLKLQKQVDYMESHPGCSLCFHAAEIVQVDKKPTGRVIKPHNKDCVNSTQDIIVGGGGFCPTASLLFPKKLISNLPKFYIKAPVGDYPLVIFLSSQGYAYYIDELMSVYRKGVKGSWSNKMLSGKDKMRITHIDKTIDMLDEFNKYSNYKYFQAVDKAKLSCEFEKLVIEKKIKELKTTRYEKYYNSFGTKGKIKLHARSYFPKLYRELVNIKAQIKQLIHNIKNHSGESN